MKKILSISIFLFLFACEDKVEKDTIPPTVSIVKPSEGGILKGIVSVEVQAEDDDAIASVSISLNNEVDTTILQPPYSYSWDTNNNSNGEYALLAKALDASGNEGISTPINVTVKNGLDGTYKLSLASMECGGRIDVWYVTIDGLTVTNWDYIGDECDDGDDCYYKWARSVTKDGDALKFEDEEGNIVITRNGTDGLKTTWTHPDANGEYTQIWDYESSEINTYSPICDD